MPEKKRTKWIILGSAAFVAYLFAASAPIGGETVLRPVWFKAAEKGGRKPSGDEVPFIDRERFGYFTEEGEFTLVEPRAERTALSAHLWANYGRTDETIPLRGTDGSERFALGARGYPFMADGRVFSVSPEQNSVVAFDESGRELWRRDFAAPICCADAAAGLALFGLLDGTIELIDAEGGRIFGFEPGGSRLPVIAAARIAPDGERIALISGIDPQRFVLLARSGRTYKVVHHEYLDKGFRRPVLAAFVQGGRFVVFERSSGLAVHDVDSGRSAVLPVPGAIVAFEDEAADERFFLIAEVGGRRELIGAALPNGLFMRAPFDGEESFLARRGSRLYVGGGGAVAALDIERK